MSVESTSSRTSAVHPSTVARPGAMTAVMRSAAVSTGPKVLRVGVVQEGRVVDDRILKDRVTVTVGASEQATLVVTAPRIGPVAKLFERVGDGYTLHVLPGMTGRVALEDGVREVASLGPRVRLTDAARGRLVLGDTTLLFQFVAPPIAPSRPQLPLSIEAGLASQIDWGLTIIAAFSFLAHFGVVGAMYSDWMDPVLDTQATANGVVELMTHMPAAPLEIPPDTAAPTDRTAEPAHTTVAAAAPAHHAAPSPHARPTPVNEAALSAAAAAIGVDALTALEAHGTAVARALDSSDIPMVNLDRSAESAAGTQASTGNDLHFGVGSNAVLPGSTSNDLGALGHTAADLTHQHAGPEAQIAGPRVHVTVDDPVAAGAGPADASRVVAGLRSSFRNCYNSGLRVDPTMSGKVTLTARVSPNGEVASTDASDNVGLSSGVVQCLLRKLGTAQFDKVPAPVSVKIPVGFVQQSR